MDQWIVSQNKYNVYLCSLNAIKDYQVIGGICVVVCRNGTPGCGSQMLY